MINELDDLLAETGIRVFTVLIEYYSRPGCMCSREITHGMSADEASAWIARSADDAVCDDCRVAVFVFDDEGDDDDDDEGILLLDQAGEY